MADSLIRKKIDLLYEEVKKAISDHGQKKNKLKNAEVYFSSDPDNEWRLRYHGRRISLGLAKKGGCEALAMVYEPDGGTAEKIVREILSIERVPAVGHQTGRVYSLGKENSRSHDCEKIRVKDYQPGHLLGQSQCDPASLTLNVRLKQEGSAAQPGFLTPAHVVWDDGHADVKTPIFTPDESCEYDQMKMFARLQNYRRLKFYRDVMASEKPLNYYDVAACVYTDPNTGPKFNLVPHPSKPRSQADRVLVTSVCTYENLLRYLEEEVYFIGAASGFVRAKISALGVWAWPIILPMKNYNRYYLYGDLCTLAGKKQDGGLATYGDSGALVYAMKPDGTAEALGFVVGGDFEQVFFLPAERNLEAMGASLWANRPAERTPDSEGTNG